MKILSLKLNNFRGIKDLEFDFGDKNTIYGANGTGKTTVANAISYLITGQPITGEKDFNPKTAETHNLHHTVSGSFELDTGEIINFSKDFHEVWKKKKGSEKETLSGHTVDYFINGVPIKEKDYIKAMEKVCGGDINRAKLLMMAGYFAETLSMEARRNILFELCDEITDTEVIKNNDLEALNEYLRVPGTTSVYGIDEYKKIATNRRKELNHKLETIPERIDELVRSIPELPNKEEIELELNNAKIKFGELQIKRNLLTTDDGFKVSADKQIAVIKNHIEEYRAAYNQKNNTSNEEIYKKIDDLSKQRSDLYLSKSQLDIDIHNYKVQIKQLMKERVRLLDEFAEVAQKEWKEEWNEQNTICPTCGQKLPEEKIEEVRKSFLERRDAFYKKIAMRKEQINAEGQKCSFKIINELEEKVKTLEKEFSDTDTKISEIDNEIDKARKQITIVKSFEETPTYSSLIKQIEKLEKDKADSVSKAKEQTVAIDDEIQGIQEKINVAERTLLKFDVVENTKKRILELEDERKANARKLEDLEHGLYLCEKFIRAKANMITENINSNFSLVQFRLFKEQMNNGTKEICDPVVKNANGQWVEYKSVNTASKVNADLEIIDVLSKHYKINLPVIVDRAESVTDINPISSQMIRLIVSVADKTLRIEKG